MNIITHKNKVLLRFCERLLEEIEKDDKTLDDIKSYLHRYKLFCQYALRDLD